MSTLLFNRSLTEMCILIFISIIYGINCYGYINSSTYTDIIYDDYGYLIRSKVSDVKPMGMLSHFSRSETPKYTIFLFNVFSTNSIIKNLNKKMYVHLVRHLDHYDTNFSESLQIISPNTYPNVRSVYSMLGRGRYESLSSGTVPEDRYISTTVSAVAFINNLVRKGIVDSLENSAIYGSCVGGIIGSAASTAMKSSLGAVVLNGSAMFMPDVVRVRLARKSALANVKYLIIHSTSDSVIPFVHAENTRNSLVKWGSSVHFMKYEGISHVQTMIKHKYTGFRFIASVLIRRPEIFRPQDTENAELLNRTKSRVDRSSIVPIVPRRNETETIKSEYDKAENLINSHTSASGENFLVLEKDNVLVITSDSPQ
ncbi:hypothetical protein FG386_003347 [Cryptosporidium ryanae]|uniref:uncharacterized protein n=1 Tax=Cryptosporidium ryanae TaxID=515981 RepID=UPI00351A0DFF|nr:hypothetical protein FG386_003347 [Cryptosporidium ryanae]